MLSCKAVKPRETERERGLASGGMYGLKEEQRREVIEAARVVGDCMSD